MKGFLFTITTLLLLGSLSIFNSFYLKINQETQNSMPVVNVASKIGYLEDDIANDYFDLLGIDFKKIERNNNSIAIEFWKMYDLYNGKNYTQTLDNYEDFIENSYARLINSQIELELSQNFSVAPYNISSQSSGESFYLYTDSFNDIQNIMIEVQANKFNITGSGSPANDVGDCPTISVKIKDVYGTTIMEQSLHLNPNNTHSPFSITFNDASSLNITFGNYNKPGTLAVKANNLTASISKLEMDYDITDKNVFIVADGKYEVNMNVGSMAKTGYLILAKE